MKTWKFPFVLLNYKNLSDYTDFSPDVVRENFTLPRVANCVRAHVLRDQGGYWLDTDTIMIGDTLPETTLIGYPSERTGSIGYLYANHPHQDFYERWCEFQDEILANPDSYETHWSILSNDFTDEYAKTHREISITPINDCWPETYMISGNSSRYEKYQEFYFERKYYLSDIHPTNMLMLHNSWTPEWYKKLSSQEALNDDCTLSGILKEVLSL